MDLKSHPQRTLATKPSTRASTTGMMGREQNTRAPPPQPHRLPRPARNHHPTHPTPPHLTAAPGPAKWAPVKLTTTPPSQWCERKRAQPTRTTRSPSTRARAIYTAPTPLCPPQQQERELAASALPFTCPARARVWLREKLVRSDRHGEVAVLREGAHEQGGLDQGGGPASDRVHQGQRGRVLALAAQVRGPAPLRQELPPPLDELPPPRPQARQLHRRRGRAHHTPPRHPRQQVVSDRGAAAGQDGQRDQELLEHAHQAQAALPRHGPQHAPPARGRRPVVPPGASAAHIRAGESGRRDVRPDVEEAGSAGRVLGRRRRQQRRDEHGRAAVPRPQPRPVGRPAGGRHAHLALPAAARLSLLPPRLPRRRPGGDDRVQLPPGRQLGLPVT